MSKPEELRRITDNTLHGLVADESLKFRILQKAAGQDKASALRPFRAMPALCAVIAALLIAVLALNTLQPVTSAGPGEIIAFAAGNPDSHDSAILPSGFDMRSVVKIELTGIGTVTDPQQCILLCTLLKDQSESVEPGEVSNKNRLVISLSDGTSVSFDAADPFLTGSDGRIWSCAAFFTDFNNQIK